MQNGIYNFINVEIRKSPLNLTNLILIGLVVVVIVAALIFLFAR